MATEKANEVVEQKSEEVVEATANPMADAPKKNAVASEPTSLSNEAEDLGPAVVKPTDSNPDATKKNKKASDAVNAKAQDGDSSGQPDTDAGVTKAIAPTAGVKAEEVEVKEEDIDLSDDVKALIGDENLSEEFKAKAATIFEAAVRAKIAEAKEKLDVDFAEKLEEETKTTKSELVEKVDSYLNYVVEEWMTQNEIAVERGIKGEIAEDFITGLKKLFEDHYINVPDEKYDVLEDQAQQIEELNKKLNEQIDSNVKLNSEIGKLVKQDIIDEASSLLTDTQKEKFNKLAEEVDYSNSDDFKKKVSTIKESYFESTKEISSNNEIDNVSEGETGDVDMTSAMQAYTAAISKTKDIKLSIK
tara:strand:- start:1351 stop:2430 length:1080 start_codon:yes stop_codon:yes gene_type:complete